MTMLNVKITPSFGDRAMEGEYDEGRFLQAEDAFKRAAGAFARAGDRSENFEAALVSAAEEEDFGPDPPRSERAVRRPKKPKR